MSDNWLQFIPTDPAWRPELEAAEAAAALLRSYAPEADEVAAEFPEAIEFFHPGGNWEGVNCPACGADLEDWFEDVAEAAAESGFIDLVRTVPCCSAEVSLNDLAFGMPAGFASFELQAMNPNLPDVSPEQLQALSARIGHPLRRIWLHI